MTPSLTEIFNARYPLEIRDAVADEEDLWGSELTFNGNPPVHLQEGFKVKVIKVDVGKGTHEVVLESGAKREFSNDEDVYVETS